VANSGTRWYEIAALRNGKFLDNLSPAPAAFPRAPHDAWECPAIDEARRRGTVSASHEARSPIPDQQSGTARGWTLALRLY